jgi:hypothetical protein
VGVIRFLGVVVVAAALAAVAAMVPDSRALADRETVVAAVAERLVAAKAAGWPEVLQRVALAEAQASVVRARLSELEARLRQWNLVHRYRHAQRKSISIRERACERAWV